MDSGGVLTIRSPSHSTPPIKQQPGWLKELKLHRVKPESQSNPFWGVASSRYCADLTSLGMAHGRRRYPIQPIGAGGFKIRNCTAVIMNV